MEKDFSDFYDEMMSYVDYDAWAELIKDRITELNKIENLLEIGCGTGEILNRLKKYFVVHGIDNSVNMIEKAKKKYDAVSFVEKDMLNLDEEKKYDAIISNFDTFNYLKNTHELNIAFRNVKNALKQNGVFLFDVLNRKMIDHMFPEGIFADDRKDMTIIWKHEYNTNTELDEIVASFFLREKEKNYVRYDEKFVKKIFTQKEILKNAEEVGLKFVSKEINTEIAGPRIIYIFQRVE